MVVQHNLQAMNSNRMLGITQGQIAGSTEKLSSGYQINRAADNAAGLSISEKMRKQIRGLDQASTNAEDGISCVQTAEGAMAEVQEMLQRMNELCVQAANGTNSMTDRQYIQDEIDQLVDEIDRVAETSKFNETYLLKGDEANGKINKYITSYSMTYALNSEANINKNGPKHKVNYRGQNNLYIVSTSIHKGNSSMHLTATKIGNGDDITDYMAAKEGAPNKAGAVLSASYQAFVAVELNYQVESGYGGDVYSAMEEADKSKVTLVKGKADEEYNIDLSTDGTSSTVRANRDLYIYNSKTQTMTKVKQGEDMTEYLDVDATGKNLKASMKDGFRLMDILYGDPSQSKDTAEPDANNALKTSKRVLVSKIVDDDSKGFEWNNKVLEVAMAENQLYDADGQVVSGIALNKYFDDNGKYTGGLFATKEARAVDEILAKDGTAVFGTASANKGNWLDGVKATLTISKYISQASTQVAKDLSVTLHVGADSDRANKVTAQIQSITAAGLGVDKLASWNIGIVDQTGNNATSAIDVVAEALQQVSTQRSALGAVQNRLEHTIKNLDNVVENTTAAESRIRDTDMAEEMVQYSNNNVLQQAGQSMLAQSNQANQGVLSLLQ